MVKRNGEQRCIPKKRDVVLRHCMPGGDDRHTIVGRSRKEGYAERGVRGGGNIRRGEWRASVSP